MAVNELSIVHYLMGGQLPAQKWAAAVSPITDRLPVVPLLGACLHLQHSENFMAAIAAVSGRHGLSYHRPPARGAAAVCVITHIDDRCQDVQEGKRCTASSNSLPLHAKPWSAGDAHDRLCRGI